MKSLKRTVISMAVAGMCGAAVADAAEVDVAVSGFADISFVATDDATAEVAGKSPTEGKFGSAAEVDIVGTLNDKITVRVDADLDLVTNGGANVAGSDSGRIEQAFFAVTATEDVTVLGGVFNSPIGWEAEDITGMYQISHGQIWDILDGQTTLDGNNVAGLAAAVNLGMVTVTAGLLNDLQQTNEENSVALVVDASPVTGVDVQLGYVTQASRTDSAGTGTYGSQGTVVGSAEDVLDLNATYRRDDLTLAIEYLMTDKVIDAAYALVGNYKFGNGFGATARFDSVGYGDPFAAVEDTDTLTLAGSYAWADNLTVMAEWRSQSDDNDTNTVPGGGVIADGDLVQLKFVGTF